MGQALFSQSIARLLGTNSSANSFEAPASAVEGAAGTALETSTPGTTKTPGYGADSVSIGSESDTKNSFEAITYHSQVQQLSLAARLQQLRAKMAANRDGESETSNVQGEQLAFDFFGEVRIEELAAFSQKTTSTAQGLSGKQQETYMEVSQKVSARFQMSLTISGEALSGFTRASDSLADDTSDLMDSFLSFANKVLSDSDESMNDMFKLLGGFFNSDSDFSKTVNKFLNDLLGSMSSGSTSKSNDAASSGSSQVQLSIQMEFSFEFSGSISISQADVQQSDPVTLDLDGDGMELTSYLNGAKFDIAGNGKAATTAFVTGGDAFLAIDRNGNGNIDSGKELFGDQNGAMNGYEELSKLDSNKDGLIDSHDKDFDKLVLFRDNGDGRTEAGELLSLRAGGIAELSLNYRNVNERTSGGNAIGQVASYRRNDGSVGRTADTILNYKS